MGRRSRDLHGNAPDQCRAALLLVDVINDLEFPEAEALFEAALPAARRIARLAARARKAGVPVIYANDNYGIWQSDFHSLVAQCLGRQDTSAAIARLLAPRATDLTLLKPRHSAFHGSPLELLLREMGARELILCGLAADICVLLTAADAFLRGFEVWVPADCTAAETPQAKAAALRYMEKILQSWGVDGHNSHTNVCSASARLGYDIWQGFDRPSPDHANARFMLLMSSHLETGHYFNPHAQRIIEAKMKGAKLAVVDPRLSNTASMADYWLAPWPGTEAAMLLAIARYLLANNLFDREYIKDAGNTGDGLGMPTFIAGEPRMWGASLTLRLGGR